MPPPKIGAPGVPEVCIEGAPCHLHEVSLTHQQPHHGGGGGCYTHLPKAYPPCKPSSSTSETRSAPQGLPPCPSATPQAVNAPWFQLVAEGARDLSPVAREG